ncbi:3-dehydroquinate synthase [Robiginitalea sp. SC105]|uniref:3-dehydroquinate synthase n=1 Tax=Robiginitalea sp. SC105 TaxID=2762332 RepID=UPI0016395E87|nr:3-dehydroquinate synthase [Robiginitalea sp. SC105]MBC2840624.1 3-dehydroquinate synthase [Robiginitalea sp. SC105]
MNPIQTASHSVHFEEAALGALKTHLEETPYSRIFLLTDSNTSRLCRPVLCENFPEAGQWVHLGIPAGEAHKNIESCTAVWQGLSENGADRQSLLVNLGGGVVTDLGGFVASTYQRGIRFINIPTTLLSMVDASVGGKTGVDLGPLKNQIGVINQPEMVLISPTYLETLDARELRSGFAEMLKHGLIRDAGYWEELAALESPVESIPHIRHSVALKNEVVLADPTEKNLRKILNFGHTLGHAIESHFLGRPDLEPLLHGEAIAIGMIMEAYISTRISGLGMDECNRIREGLLKFFPKTRIPKQQQPEIFRLLIHDKKNTHGRVLFSLLERIGKAVYNQEVPAGILAEAFDYYRD